MKMMSVSLAGSFLCAGLMFCVAGLATAAHAAPKKVLVVTTTLEFRHSSIPTAEKVLGELEALGKPRIEVLNKIDLLDAHEREGLESREHPHHGEVMVSARTGEGMEALLAAVDKALHSDPVIDAELCVPQRDGAALAAIDAGTVVHQRRYEGNVVRLAVSGPASLLGRLRQYRVRDDKERGTKIREETD